jgi:hypothetical protein
VSKRRARDLQREKKTERVTKRKKERKRDSVGKRAQGERKGGRCHPCYFIHYFIILII